MESINFLLLNIFLNISSNVIVEGFKRLGQRLRRQRYAGIYDGVEDFWYRGVEEEGIADNSKVKITGLLSPLAPFIPSHPRAKPGYSVEGWEAVSNRLKTIIRNYGGRVPDDPYIPYDAADLLVWGDAVIRLPPLAGKKIYAGLYNRYGKSYECLPVFLNGQDKKIQQLELNRIYGHLVEVTGVVRKIPSFYESLGIVYPIETMSYPCYSIEVSDVNVLSASKLVLYATAWTGTEDGTIITEFFDFMLSDELQKGLQMLHKRTYNLKKPVWFYYDFINCPYKELSGNKQLIDKCMSSLK